MSLIRAAEKFDIARGNRFSTYASWAIMKNFARTISDAFRHRDRFCTSCPEMFNIVEDMRSNHYEQESAQIQRESYMERLLDRLDERERQIITQSFWPDSWPGTDDLGASRSRDGRNQRAGPTDPMQGDEQIEKGCQRGPNRGPRVKNKRHERDLSGYRTGSQPISVVVPASTVLSARGRVSLPRPCWRGSQVAGTPGRFR